MRGGEEMKIQIPTKYMNASMLTGEKVYTIAEIQLEKLRDKEKYVLYFQEDTIGLPLNITNLKTLISAYGNDTDNWVGKKVRLKTATIIFNAQQKNTIIIEPL